MNKELFRLLEGYKNSEVDKDFLIQSFDIMMDEEDGLRDEFVDYMKVDDKLKSIGAYTFEDKRISVNLENVKKCAAKRTYYNDKLYALYVLRHELEHARSIKRLYEFRDDIESLVTNYSLRSHFIIHNIYGAIIPEDDYYVSSEAKRAYIFNPDERMADIKAWRFVNNLIKNQRGSQDLMYARSMLYFSYLRGYEANDGFLDPPTYSYLLMQHMFNNYKYLKRRVESKNYSFATRALCGLPITYHEYDRELPRYLGLHKVE